MIGPIEDRTWDVAAKASKILETTTSGSVASTSTCSTPEGGPGPVRAVTTRSRASTELAHHAGTSGGWVDILGGIPGCDLVIATGPPQYRVHNVQFSEDRPATGYEWALFVQEPGRRDHWVLKIGVRATAQTLRGAGDYTLNFAWDPEDPRYFTDTPTYYPAHEYSFQTEYSPRLGVSFDPGDNGKTKIYASAARYFERVPADLAARQFSQSTGLQEMRFSDPYLTTRAPGPIYAGGLNQSYVMDGTRLPYMDEATLGWQQLLRPDLSLEVRGIYRTRAVCSRTSTTPPRRAC